MRLENDVLIAGASFSSNRCAFEHSARHTDPDTIIPINAAVARSSQKGVAFTENSKLRNWIGSNMHSSTEAEFWNCMEEAHSNKRLDLEIYSGLDLLKGPGGAYNDAHCTLPFEVFLTSLRRKTRLQSFPECLHVLLFFSFQLGPISFAQVCPSSDSGLELLRR